ncbi:MAG TPA: hypothetical protein VEK07_05785 [Polyangiaceae bacterium]|nr:hypothetical protein [Polyangiaceae bacterium]
MASVEWRQVEALIVEIERRQLRTVIELGRRLCPGLTQEDLRNPHDHPELADADWQYADGMLAGIQSVLAAIRARRREAESAQP